MSLIALERAIWNLKIKLEPAILFARMTAQTIIDGKDVLYPNGPTFDPSGKLIWARLSNIPGHPTLNSNRTVRIHVIRYTKIGML